MNETTRKELQARLDEFVAYRKAHLVGDEKGEAQVFLERLFLAMGYDGLFEAGATLEKRVRRHASGRVAFADLVWRPRLLLEMKKSGVDLGRHYQQAFEYWIDLVPDRPQFVILCNFDEFWVYDLNRQLDEPVDRIPIDDLSRRWEALGFMLPVPVTPVFSNDLVDVTREAAATLVGVANSMIERGLDRPDTQRFVMQSLVAMVAEDLGLLPSHMFTKALEDGAGGASTYDLVFGLFREMNQPGVTPAGRYAGTPYFNGSIFSQLTPAELTLEEVQALHEAAKFDWRAIRPEIFGTLFEQSLGKDERHAMGAHFTSGADIQRVVLPTIVKPWRARITNAGTLRELGRIEQDLLNFRVLDPACGSGNFLYIAYRELRKLEREISVRRKEISKRAQKSSTAQLGFVQPSQFYGIDINAFAVEIAKVTLMLGKQLAAVEEGDEQRALPLDDLEGNFVVDDALFVDWPESDAIIGNPPYLGRRRLIDEYGAAYADRLKSSYPRVGGVSDYVVYWFRRSHDHLDEGQRAGLVGTNTVRQTDTRKASLDYILDNDGTILDAWSSLPWSGDANVYVSIVNWIKGRSDEECVLWLDEGERRIVLERIHGSLSEEIDLQDAKALRANKVPKIAFQGQTVGHTDGFVVDDETAGRLRSLDIGTRESIHPYLTAEELLHGGRTSRWVIDIDAGDATAAKAAAPSAFEHVRLHVLPDRQFNADREKKRNEATVSENPDAKPNWHHRRFLDAWWQLSYRRAEFLAAIADSDRYLALAGTSSENRKPVFAFVSPDIRPSHAIQAFALDDDYSFAILQSEVHELWFRNRCSTLEERLRYTARSVFDSFPWPQTPTEAMIGDVAKAGADLLEYRETVLSGHMTLAKLYDTLADPGRNKLRNFHRRLDEVVRSAYGFDASEDQLSLLLELNGTCAGREAVGQDVTSPGPSSDLDVHISSVRIEP